ncbi:glycine cleavage system protein H [Anaerosporomusa subterranea]|uniref:Glycine cleavage system H protein n=1 Tax=Anaerosporomusa subterranea TaxID=1794912 RepID=A0A154BPF8_ANASB|nr:glycine cleavage system protein GcvH [Anaerosporomusa subterranea]KYZ75864.1 glycine cleavage system protein H [Anaerosporomusa subterranea]
MSIPAELKYSTDHEWVRVEGNTAIIGVTDFAQSQLGDVVFVELPNEGDSAKAGQRISVIESVKAVSDIISPLSGKVIRTNQELNDAPELVNQSPYGDGWILVIELSNPKELTGLLDDAAYSEIVEKGGH